MTTIENRPKGRPRLYDKWFEFNYEYHKIMDRERKKDPIVHAKRMEYQKAYRARKKQEKMNTINDVCQ